MFKVEPTSQVYKKDWHWEVNKNWKTYMRKMVTPLGRVGPCNLCTPKDEHWLWNHRPLQITLSLNSMYLYDTWVELLKNVVEDDYEYRDIYEVFIVWSTQWILYRVFYQ